MKSEKTCKSCGREFIFDLDEIVESYKAVENGISFDVKVTFQVTCPHCGQSQEV